MLALNQNPRMQTYSITVPFLERLTIHFGRARQPGHFPCCMVDCKTVSCDVFHLSYACGRERTSLSVAELGLGNANRRR
jgi:hypothetical protein